MDMDSLERIALTYVLPIIAAFTIAWIVRRTAGWLVRHFVHLSDFAPENIRLGEKRQRTLNDLISSGIGFLAFLMAMLFTLGLFVDTTTLVWMVGLFSAAFGLGARPLISDFLTGIGFIFEDTFDVGEKIQINGVEGVIEKINMRTTFVRAPTGELYIIPNGEIRIIRNFSRGRFSTADITIRIRATDLKTVMPLLEELGREAVSLLPNLLQPWQVISPSGAIGQTAELTLATKAKFGKAADMRPHLLALVHERLAQADIELVS